jgi:hypothetical protein
MRNARVRTRSFGRFAASFIACLALLILVAPRDAAADPIFRTITIAWDPSPTEAVIGYRVNYGTQSGQYTNIVDVGGATSADLPNMIDGTTYFFAIVAYTAAGEASEPSSEFVHTVNPGMLLNISARANVQSGDDVVIAGFIVGGSSRKTVVIRALGPSLADAGIAQPLQNPTLDVFGPDGHLASNDNWRDSDVASLLPWELMPRNDYESALVLTLSPGAYTAIVRGAGGSTGTALLEVYDTGVPAQP